MLKSAVKSMLRPLLGLFRFSWLRRGMMFGVTLPSSVLIRTHGPDVALIPLKPLFRVARKSTRFAFYLQSALLSLGLTRAADKAQAIGLNRQLQSAIKKRQYYAMLCLLAQIERTTEQGLFSAGQLIVRKLYKPEPRARLAALAERALQDYPDSVYLLHLVTTCQAMNGDSQGANEVLLARLQDTFDHDKVLERRRFKMLRETWRVIDLTARERMEWLEPDGDYGAMRNNAMEGSADLNTAKRPDETIATHPLGFREHALQGRMRTEYLESCLKDFKRARKLTERMQAINEMLRVGIRHIPDYGPSYDLARDCMNTTWPEIELLLQKAEIRIVNRELRMITIAAALLNKLGFADRTQACVDCLHTLSGQERYAPVMWPALPVLAVIPAHQHIADEIADNIGNRLPKTDRDVRDYLRWAAFTGRYLEAAALYKKLSPAKRRSTGMLQYVVILQRRGRLKEALELTKRIHAQALANPSNVPCYTSYTLFKRIGELEFLIQTAKVYRLVPQPKRPKGIVLIVPRNIDQLRRYPILVLNEFKRLGWAVVPLVEGLLPREVTGIEQIDAMNGALRPTSKLCNRAAAVMPPLTDFNLDAAQGTLTWRDMTLSHPLWEDSAINRRRYSVDYSCPRLQEYVTGLAGWSNSVGRVLDYAHQVHKELDLPVACTSLYSSRLPDAVFRPYCEKYGSPDGFFFVHCANGYQNYFTNFSTNISHLFVMRNITKAPETRSASFPIPQNYERYFKERQDQGAAMLAKYQDVTKVKRSTVGQSQRAPDAEAALDRIRTWREKGGKVVCAFGKVVCDSGVPFDGGTSHRSMKDWINHSVASVKDSNTLLLIKPHPHELNDQIATFPTEYFKDLIDEPMNENVMFLGHRWFDIHDMKDLIDVGLIYNGTTAIELGILGIPCLLSGHFSGFDYPIGHKIPEDRDAYARYIRFEDSFDVREDLQERAAVWLDYMSNENFTQSYRFHCRPVTNKVAYPPWWIGEDLDLLESGPIQSVETLAARALGMAQEPGGIM